MKQVCQPIISDGTTCDDPINVGRYIEDFTCRGDDSSKRMLKEIRLSFPSGHSSFTFYTMVYTAVSMKFYYVLSYLRMNKNVLNLQLYLQARMNWHGSKLLRHFLQFLFIMVAWYTALSRVSDYKHHWSDVLAGSTIGALTAVIVVSFSNFSLKNNELWTQYEKIFTTFTCLNLYFYIYYICNYILYVILTSTTYTLLGNLKLCANTYICLNVYIKPQNIYWRHIYLLFLALLIPEGLVQLEYSVARWAH